MRKSPHDRAMRGQRSAAMLVGVLALARSLTWVTAVVSALVAALILHGVAAPGQDQHSRPVKLVVGFTAGGTTDFVARLLAEHMRERLAQSVIVENKPGANGAIAAEYVAKSEPDGTTLLFTTVGAVAINPALRSNLPYDTIRDFVPVGLAVLNSTMLVVNAGMAVNSARELAELARNQPGAVTIGVTGLGAISHLGLELYQAAAGVKFQAVPYRGASQAVTDVLGGSLDGLFADVPTIITQVQAGKLKALDATSKQRSEMFPDVPTFLEQGYADTFANQWAGILAPARTPSGTVASLNAALNLALRDPDTHSILAQTGVTPSPGSPAEFGDYLREEIARWAKVIREKGIKGE